MADILIPRMILPKEGERYYLTIDHNGEVCRFVRKKPKDEPKYVPYSTAIELPSHGRLIDADQLQDVLRLVLSLVVSNELTEKEISLVHRTIGAISEAINDLDTVLEAST